MVQNFTLDMPRYLRSPGQELDGHLLPSELVLGEHRLAEVPLPQLADELVLRAMVAGGPACRPAIHDAVH